MKFKVTGLQKLRSDVDALTARLKDLGPAYLRAATVVLASAQMRIRTKDSGSWAPQATGPDGSGNDKGTLLFRTGALMRSLTVGGMDNIVRDIESGVRVGTTLNTEDGHNIGLLMQYGTGPITPKKGKFLVFEINGQKVFSKGTKGIPARPFLYIDKQDADRVKAVFSQYILKGVTDGGS